MNPNKVRTTVSIASDLLRRVDLAIEEGVAASRNEFLAVALEKLLAAHRRERIDAAFAEMAQDRTFQSEALEIEDEFQHADAEAWSLADDAS